MASSYAALRVLGAALFSLVCVPCPPRFVLLRMNSALDTYGINPLVFLSMVLLPRSNLSHVGRKRRRRVRGHGGVVERSE